MDKKQSKPRMFLYDARTEHGLMIMGTREAMQNFSDELSEALSKEQTLSSQWPTQIYSPIIESPYADKNYDFSLSFHLEEEGEPIYESLRKKRTSDFLGNFLVFGVVVVAILIAGSIVHFVSKITCL